MELLVGFIILLILLILLSTKRRPTKYMLPPGPPGLPVIGNLHQLEAAAPYESLSRLAEIWGRIFSLRLGGVHCVVISDRQILQVPFTHLVSFSRC
jgi:hypothetical protein